MGNSVKSNNYNFVDKIFSQTAYYRLKQMDFGNKYTYSNIISLEKVVEKGNLKIYPNPLSNQPFLTVDLSENNQNQATIAIFEANGHLIHQNTEGVDIVKIPVNDWANGLYLIRLTTHDGATTTTKFVKN